MPGVNVGAAEAGTLGPLEEVSGYELLVCGCGELLGPGPLDVAHILLSHLCSARVFFLGPQKLFVLFWLFMRYNRVEIIVLSVL